MPTREELLKQAKRKMLLEKAKEKMAASQEVPEESSYGLMDALDDAGTFMESVGRGIPILGPLAEKGGAALAGMSDEEYDQYKARQQEESPTLTGAGELVGTMAGFGAAPAALPAQLGISAADHMMRGEGAEGTAKNVAMEGAAGVMLPAAFKSLGKAASKASQGLAKGAERQAEKAVGLNMSKKLRDTLAKMESTGRIGKGDIGRQLLDADLMRPGGARKLADRATQQKELAGREIGDLLERTGDIPVDDLKSALRARLPETPILNEVQQTIENKVTKQIDMLDEAGSHISATDLNKAKSEIGKQVKDFLAESAPKEANKRIYHAMKESIEDSMDEKMLEKLRAANKKYQAMKMAEDAALGKAGTPESALGKLAAVGSASHGNMVLPAAVVSRSLWNKYGNTLAAAGLEKGSKIAAKHATRFMEAAEKGPQAVAALHYILMKDDPEYRKSHTKEEK